MPAGKELVLQVAVFTLGAPAGSATAPQLLTVVPLSVKARVPVGDEPETVAVNVTFAPAIDGFTELARLVVLVVKPIVTTWASGELLELVFAASPPYAATML